ncbi:MAG: SRPBCC family protein [Thermoplasmatota archaeon]
MNEPSRAGGSQRAGVATRKLVWSWNGDGAKPNALVTTVTWTLEPTADGGTRLRLVHSGLKGMRGMMMRAGMNNGWNTKIHGDAFRNAVAGTAAAPVPGSH